MFRRRWALTSSELAASQSSVSSKSLGSSLPTWSVKRKCASGSATHGLCRRTSARMPIWAHSFQANSRSSRETRSLSAEICTFDSEMGERPEQFRPKALGRVVRNRPVRGLDELVACRLERSQVGLVLARPLIDESVEFEVDL